MNSSSSCSHCHLAFAALNGIQANAKMAAAKKRKEEKAAAAQVASTFMAPGSAAPSVDSDSNNESVVPPRSGEEAPGSPEPSTGTGIPQVRRLGALAQGQQRFQASPRACQGCTLGRAAGQVAQAAPGPAAAGGATERQPVRQTKTGPNVDVLVSQQPWKDIFGLGGKLFLAFIVSFLVVCATGTETVNETVSSDTSKQWLHSTCDIVVNQEFYDLFVIPFPEKT
eukprot:3831543-Rhodomonas_salina.1